MERMALRAQLELSLQWQRLVDQKHCRHCLGLRMAGIIFERLLMVKPQTSWRLQLIAILYQQSLLWFVNLTANLLLWCKKQQNGKVGLKTWKSDQHWRLCSKEAA